MEFLPMLRIMMEELPWLVQKDNAHIFEMRQANLIFEQHLASSEGHQEIVEFLLGHKADVTCRKPSATQQFNPLSRPHHDTTAASIRHSAVQPTSTTAS